MNEPTRLVTTKPDADLAEDFKKEMVEALGPVAAIVERAKKQGFIIQFNLAPGPLGPIVITQLQIMKQF